MKAILNGAEIHTRKALHRQLQTLLALPDYYGCNLDALYDCLSTLHEETELVITDADALEAQLGFYAKSLQIVLRRAAMENPCFQYVLSNDAAE